MKGIFEISKHPTDRNKDKLRWCFAAPDHPRPKSFSIEPGSNHKLIELERYVVDEAKTLRRFKSSTVWANKNIQQRWTEYLTLENIDDPDFPISEIRQLRKLHTLKIDSASEEVVRAIAGHLALKILLLNCEVSAETLSSVVDALPDLHQIEFGCKVLTPEHGKALARLKPGLTVGITNNDGDLSGLSELKHFEIKSLALSDSQINQSSLTEIASHLDQLEQMHIKNCEVSDRDLELIGQMPNLTNLSLTDCGITDDGIRNLKSHPKLYSIRISGCTSVSSDSLLFLINNLPSLSYVSAFGIDLDDRILNAVKDRSEAIYINVLNSKANEERLAKAPDSVTQSITMFSNPF